MKQHHTRLLSRKGTVFIDLAVNAEATFVSDNAFILEFRDVDGDLHEPRFVFDTEGLAKLRTAIGRVEMQKDEDDDNSLYILLPPNGTLEEKMGVVERNLVIRTLRQCSGNKEETAKALSISRSRLFKLMKAWGYTVPPSPVRNR